LAGASGKPGVHFVSDRLFVVAEEPGMKACLERTPRKDNSGKLVKLLGSVSGSHHLVAGAVVPPAMVQQARQNMGPFGVQFGPLLDAQTVLLSASIGETSTLDLTVAYPDTGKSKLAKDAVDAALGMAKGFIGMAGMGAQAPPEQKQAIAAAQDALNKIVVEQRGSDLCLSVKSTIDT